MTHQVLAFSLALGLLVAPFAAEGQKSEPLYRIGYISMRSGPTDDPQLEAFRDGLRELGYLEGRNVALEVRWAEGYLEKLPNLAAELVRFSVAVIVTQSGVAAIAVQKATRTIPIVMVSSGDAVRQGLVASLAHPGECYGTDDDLPGAQSKAHGTSPRDAPDALAGGRSPVR